MYRPNPPIGYPILNLDPNGKLYQVRYNNDDRSAMKGVSSDELEKWYEALRLWNKTLKSPDSEYWVQLSPGTAVSAYKDRKSTRLNSSHSGESRMPSSA